MMIGVSGGSVGRAGAPYTEAVPSTMGSNPPAATMIRSGVGPAQGINKGNIIIC